MQNTSIQSAYIFTIRFLNDCKANYKIAAFKRQRTKNFCLRKRKSRRRALFSRARMGVSIDLRHFSNIQMRIYLGGRKARMPEHFLDAPQVGVGVYEVRRKTMAQLVGRYRHWKPRKLQIYFKLPLY